MSSLNPPKPCAYEHAADALSGAARDAAEMFPQPPYPAEGHRMGCWSVANVVGHVFDARVAHHPAEEPADIWTRLHVDHVLATLAAAA